MRDQSVHRSRHARPRSDTVGRHVSPAVRALLGCGIAAGPLFVGAFLVEGATRADYDPLRHPVSSLALGEYGWTQTANFIATGLLLAAFAIGLRYALYPGRASLWGPLLIGVWGVGLIGAGAYITDPVSGYPPGTPDALTAYSTIGLLHDLFSVPAFLAPPAACFVLTRRFAGEGAYAWAVYSTATGVVFFVGFILASLGFDQNASLVDIAGLIQRATLAVGLAWAALLAMRTLRTPGPSAARQGQR